MQCPLSGCGAQPTVLVPNNSHVQSIVLDTRNAYFVRDRRVMRCALAGCGGVPTWIAGTSLRFQAIAANGTDVYQADGPTPGSIWGGIVDGGFPIMIANESTAPRFLVADALFVFWENDDRGTIEQCSAAGCNTVPTTRFSGTHQVGGLALDAKTLYWTDLMDGTITRIADY
jgi:hypothetical protein